MKGKYKMISAINSFRDCKPYNFQTNNNQPQYKITAPLKKDIVAFTGIKGKTAEVSDEVLDLIQNFIKPLKENIVYRFNEPTIERLSVIHLVPPKNKINETVHFTCISRELSLENKYMDFHVDLKTKRILEGMDRAPVPYTDTEKYEKGIELLLNSAKKHPNYPKD